MPYAIIIERHYSDQLAPRMKADHITHLGVRKKVGGSPHDLARPFEFFFFEIHRGAVVPKKSDEVRGPCSGVFKFFRLYTRQSGGTHEFKFLLRLVDQPYIHGED